MKDPTDELPPLEQLVLTQREYKNKGGRGKKNLPIPNPEGVIVGYRAPPCGSRKLGKRFKHFLALKMELYRMDALDALRDLAMMPITNNALLNQVKFMAASRLAGPAQEATSPPSEIDTALRELNEHYHKSAPKIKSIRERVVEFEQEPALIQGP